MLQEGKIDLVEDLLAGPVEIQAELGDEPLAAARVEGPVA